MKLVFEQNLGYVKCDVCGDGYNAMRILAAKDAWSVDGVVYTYTRTSQCYGRRTENITTTAGLLQVMEEDKFLLATRPAKRAFRNFQSSLRSGEIANRLPRFADAELDQEMDDIATAPAPALRFEDNYIIYEPFPVSEEVAPW